MGCREPSDAPRQQLFKEAALYGEGSNFNLETEGGAEGCVCVCLTAAQLFINGGRTSLVFVRLCFTSACFHSVSVHG